MKLFLKLFDLMRPQFEAKGRFRFFKPLFEVIEFVFFYPSTCTSNAPHVRDPLDIKRYMGTVLVAMMPCIAASVFYFGPRVLWMILVSYVVGGLLEVGFACVRKGEVHEGFFVSGMIFPLILPPSTPLWIVAVGIFFGILFGKEVFGGTGRNVFNPALVGRIFVTIAFPKYLAGGWAAPSAWWSGAETVTCATPMALAKTQNIFASYSDLLLGNTGGSIGETFHLGVILGGIYLMYTKVSDWRIPVSYIGSVFVCAVTGFILSSGTLVAGEEIIQTGKLLEAAARFGVFHVLAGGMLFGAMFMATDPVTSPFTKAGKFIFGILCGLLTVLIRCFSSYVEGVMFSIVIMNAFTPLIDHIVLAVRYKEAKV